MKWHLAFEYNADPDPKEAESEESDGDYNPGGYEAVYCYEDELDIIAILSAESIIPDQEEYGDFLTRVKLHKVELFDNKSYAKLRTIPIDHCIKLGSTESPQISLDLDRDMLIIRVKSSAKTRTLVWRLLYDERITEENGVLKEKSVKKQVPTPSTNYSHRTNDTISTVLRPSRACVSRRKSKNAS